MVYGRLLLKYYATIRFFTTTNGSAWRQAFRKSLKPYDIRRGTGNALDGMLQGRESKHLDADSCLEITTEAILRQVMNHRDAGVFQAYLNERVRCNV